MLRNLVIVLILITSLICVQAQTPTYIDNVLAKRAGPNGIDIQFELKTDPGDCVASDGTLHVLVGSSVVDKTIDVTKSDFKLGTSIDEPNPFLFYDTGRLATKTRILEEGKYDVTPLRIKVSFTLPDGTVLEGSTKLY